MKASNVFNQARDYHQDKRNGVKREPLLTLADLAREVGVNYSTLAHRFYEDGRPVEAVFRGRKVHYRAAELRAWHAKWVAARTSGGE